MFWTRKKSSGLSLHRIFSISWLPKLKKMSNNKPESRPAKTKQEIRTKSSPQCPSSPVCFGRSRYSKGGGNGFDVGSVPDLPISPEILHRRTDQDLLVQSQETFWRPSFGKQTGEYKESIDVPEDNLEFQYSGGGGCRSEAKLAGNGPSCKFREPQKLSTMLSDVRKMKLQENGRHENVGGQEETEFKTPSRIFVKEGKLSTAQGRSEQQQTIYSSGLKPKHKVLDSTSGKTVARDSRRSCCTDKINSSNSRKSYQGVADEPTISLKSMQKSVKYQMIEALLSKSEEQRRPCQVKSLDKDEELLQRKIRHRSKNGVISPRTASRIEICKIRALENLKKARKRREVEMARAFQSFAVVKCSFNPQEDFRESMIEMILENGIGQRDELENLLAWYLSLNSNEHHDTIIKVFIQVWLDLRCRVSFSEIEEGGVSAVIDMLYDRLLGG